MDVLTPLPLPTLCTDGSKKGQGGSPNSNLPASFSSSLHDATTPTRTEVILGVKKGRDVKTETPVFWTPGVLCVRVCARTCVCGVCK